MFTRWLLTSAQSEERGPQVRKGSRNADKQQQCQDPNIHFYYPEPTNRRWRNKEWLNTRLTLPNVQIRSIHTLSQFTMEWLSQSVSPVILYRIRSHLFLATARFDASAACEKLHDWNHGKFVIAREVYALLNSHGAVCSWNGEKLLNLTLSFGIIFEIS